MSFEFFTRDFPGKKIEWKKFLKGFLLKIDNHGGRRSIAGIKESIEVLKKKKIIIFYREIPLQFFQKKKKNPEILPQIYREIPLQNFYKEKSL